MYDSDSEIINQNCEIHGALVSGSDPKPLGLIFSYNKKMYLILRIFFSRSTAGEG